MKEIFPCSPLHYPIDLYRFGGGTEGQSKSGSLLDVWHELVWNYARRDLTLEKDKLPAISGLAKRLSIRSAREEKYIAGLWWSHLLCDLLWYNHLAFPADPNLSTRPASYRAPSWSWASLDCKYLEWLDVEPEVMEARISGYKLLYRSSDPFGEVQGGYLDVDAPVKTGWLVPLTSHPEHFELWDDNWRSEIKELAPDPTSNALARVYLDFYDGNDLRRVGQLGRTDRVWRCECMRISKSGGLLLQAGVQQDASEHADVPVERKRIGVFQFIDRNKVDWWLNSPRSVTRLV